MSATFSFSGTDRAELLSLLTAEQAAGMINARIALQPALRHAYMTRWPSVPLVLDSGTFQGQRDVVAYADLIEQIGSRFLWISNLDALWQPAVGERHFAYLQAHLSPALRSKVLWIFQPGGSLADVEWFARMRRLIGIGGLVPLLKQQGVEAVLRLLCTLGECLNGVGGQAHVFGISSPHILFRIRSERWLASVDSSKWLVAYRAREILRKDGTHQSNINQLGLCLTKREVAANNLRVMQFWLTPAPIVQWPLLPLLEEAEEKSPDAPAVPCEHQFMVRLQGEYDEFLHHFAGWIMNWDGSDEEEEAFFALRAPSFLKSDLLVWCEEARRIGQLPDYAIWCEEEEAAE